MMKMSAYFIKLFGYDKATNLKLIELLKIAKECDEAIGLMAHLLVAQQIWLKRCKGENTVGGSLWPDWDIMEMEAIVLRNNTDWVNFLNTLNEQDFVKSVSYKNSRGTAFANRLEDVLAHVINHGTHHRAQIGQHLKLCGHNLQSTDYIFYIREQDA
jgi:uncharacterized damage-inducible protein DinB